MLASGRLSADARPEKALRAWARCPRRRAQLRVAPITAPGEIHELPPAPERRTADGSGYGRAALRLLGLEDQVNRPLGDDDASLGGTTEQRP
jgi:hypothetical protein